jgi:hypothetical protein
MDSGIMLRMWIVPLGALLLMAGCSAPRVAARLATVTSDHINTLNGELKQYADAANASRQSDAQRIAAAQSRWDQDNAYIQPFLTQWQIDRQSALINAFEALQRQSDAEMAITDSYVKRQNDAATQLAKTYGRLSYSPGELQNVIAALQKLIDRAGAGQQISAIRDFAATTVADTKKQLKESQLKAGGQTPNGGTP